MEARGKHLLIRFAGGATLHTHMRMTGSWRTFPPGEPWRAGGRVVAVVRTERAVAVCFAAPVVELLDDRAVRRHPVLGALGPDLCLPDPDLDEIVRRSERLDPATEIGVALLDQRVAAGIGNVYKSEVAFACRVDPFTPLAELDRDRRAHLWRTASELLRRNLGPAPRTTTAHGLAVYDRAGPSLPRVRHPDRGPASGRGRAHHVVVSRLSIADAGRAPMARSRRRPPAEDRTCNTARRGTPRRRRAVGDRDPPYRGHGGRRGRVRAGRQRRRRGARGGRHARGELPPQLRRGRRPVRPGAAAGRRHDRRQRQRARAGRGRSRRPPLAVRHEHARAGSRLHHGPGRGQRLGGAARGGRHAAVARGVRSGHRARARRRRRLPFALRARWGNANRSSPSIRAWRRCSSADGVPLPRGALFRQPALGATLQRLAADGPGALYGGAIGARYAAGLRAMGSPIALDDLAAHVADIGPPLSGRYRDVDVRVVPPNSQGFALLEMLALVERLGIDPDPLGPDADVLARVFAAAHGDRDHHLADPDAMRVHPSTLLDDGHLAGLADRIRDRSASPTLPGDRHGSGDTIAMVTADAEGWAVSLIQSLWDSFGSGILEPETGIVAHDRGGCFTLEPGHPNEIGPRKRPFHTLMPVLVHREGRLAAVAGSMGGAAQPQINAQNLIRALDLGMSAGDAVAAPRWTVWGQPGEGSVLVEGRVPDDTSARLRDAGFRVDRVEDVDEAVGHAHLILARPQGGFDVGSDPRADGGALAL